MSAKEMYYDVAILFNIFFFLSFNSYGDIKNKIIQNLNSTNNLNFKFSTFCKFSMIFSFISALEFEIKTKKIKIKMYLNIKVHLFCRHDLLY